MTIASVEKTSTRVNAVIRPLGAVRPKIYIPTINTPKYFISKDDIQKYTIPHATSHFPLPTRSGPSSDKSPSSSVPAPRCTRPALIASPLILPPMAIGKAGSISGRPTYRVPTQLARLLQWARPPPRRLPTCLPHLPPHPIAASLLSSSRTANVGSWLSLPPVNSNQLAASISATDTAKTWPPPKSLPCSSAIKRRRRPLFAIASVLSSSPDPCRSGSRRFPTVHADRLCPKDALFLQQQPSECHRPASRCLIAPVLSPVGPPN